MIGSRLAIFSSRRLRIILVVLIVVASAAIFWYLWRIKVGKIELSAKTELCQNTSQLGAMYGNNQWLVGANLVPVNFQGKDVRFHRLATPWLNKVNKEIKDQKINYQFNSVETFYWRIKTTGYGQSLHSYGVAIDINPGQNPYNFSGQLITDLPQELIDIFKKYGFYWGGDWQGFVDPMHFEWYGAEIKGKLVDKNTKDEVKDSRVYVDGTLLAKIDSDFSFAIPEGRHLVEIKNSEYKSNKFKIKVACNQVIAKDIFLEPVPIGVPGMISGQVMIPPESPLELPADIYMDGIYAARTDVNGVYTIREVPAGVTHLIEARLLPIFIGSTRARVEEGKKLNDVNIKMNPSLNR